MKPKARSMLNKSNGINAMRKVLYTNLNLERSKSSSSEPSNTMRINPMVPSPGSITDRCVKSKCKVEDNIRHR